MEIEATAHNGLEATIGRAEPPPESMSRMTNDTSMTKQSAGVNHKWGLGGLGWPLVALVLTLLFDAALISGFFEITLRDGKLFGPAIDVIFRAVPVAITALGMTWVIATGGVDLSVGAVASLVGAIVAVALTSWSASWPLALVCGGAAALVAGLVNGFLVSRMNLQPIVATLVLMVAGRGIAQLATDGQIIAVESPSLLFLGRGFWLGLPAAIWIAALISLAMWLVTRRTAAGLFIEAVGTNATASRLTGVNPANVKLLAYTVCGVLAGVSGLIVTAGIGAADVNNTGVNLELDAILAAAIGGTSLRGGRFTLAGTLVGAVVIQSVTSVINSRGVPGEWALVVKALVVLFVCLAGSTAVHRMWNERRQKKVQA